MNLPNKLTMFRVILIPFFMICLYTGGTVAYSAALAIFIIAAATDFADGHIARKYNLITVFGKFADPLADKLLTFSAFCIFTEQGNFPAWVLFIILARELIVTGFRLCAAQKGTVIAAAFSGKLKTTVQFACIVLLLALETIKSMNFIGNISIFYNVSAAVITILTLYSGCEYIIKNRAVLSDN